MDEADEVKVKSGAIEVGIDWLDWARSWARLKLFGSTDPLALEFGIGGHCGPQDEPSPAWASAV